jgi:hypothetical protein
MSGGPAPPRSLAQENPQSPDRSSKRGPDERLSLALWRSLSEGQEIWPDGAAGGDQRPRAAISTAQGCPRT